MNRKLSFVVALAGLALVVVAPAAGKGPPVHEPWQQALEARGAVLNEQYGLGTTSSARVGPMEARNDELQGAIWSGRPTQAVETGNFEQALKARGEALNRAYGIGAAAQVSGDGFLSGDDHVRLDASQLPTVVVPVSSTGGDGIEWPQIGMGFVFGLLLTLGIALTVRYTRVHPLAH